MSAAVTCAISWVALPYVVARAEAPQYTVEFAVNPDPFTVSVKAVPSALVYAGDMLLMTGAGLTALLTVSVTVAVAVV